MDSAIPFVMQPAELSSHSDHPLSWFDGERGRGVLMAGQGALLPLLVSCPGSHACVLLPTAASARMALSASMHREDRLWYEPGAWAGGSRCVSDPVLPLAAGRVDLLLALHVVATLPEPQARLAEIERVLVAGGTAFVVELDPWSAWHRHWRDSGLGEASLRRMLSCLRATGLQLEASYGLRIGSQSGALLQRDWRILACLPQAAYVLRLSKRSAGTVAVGSMLGLGASGA